MFRFDHPLTVTPPLSAFPTKVLGPPTTEANVVPEALGAAAELVPEAGTAEVPSTETAPPGVGVAASLEMMADSWAGEMVCVVVDGAGVVLLPSLTELVPSTETGLFELEPLLPSTLTGLLDGELAELLLPSTVTGLLDDELLLPSTETGLLDDELLLPSTETGLLDE
jgi:hypothetical protein